MYKTRCTKKLGVQTSVPSSCSHTHLCLKSQCQAGGVPGGRRGPLFPRETPGPCSQSARYRLGDAAPRAGHQPRVRAGAGPVLGTGNWELAVPPRPHLVGDTRDPRAHPGMLLPRRAQPHRESHGDTRGARTDGRDTNPPQPGQRLPNPQRGEMGANSPGSPGSAPVLVCFLPVLPAGTPRRPRLFPTVGKREDARGR